MFEFAFKVIIILALLEGLGWLKEMWKGERKRNKKKK